MSITYSQTARAIVSGAMRDLGILGLAEDAEAEELAYGLDQLDMLLKELAAEGLTSWTAEEATVTFPAGVREMVLSPRPAEVMDASSVMSAYEHPMKRWNDGEYSALPNKAQQGYPVGYQIRFSATDVSMRLWPVPNVETTISYSYTRVLEDVVAGSPLDVPQMWIGAMRQMLAARLTTYGPISPDVYGKTELAKTRLLDFNRPESYTLGAWC